MDVTEFLKALNGIENGEELVKFFNSHTNALSEEAKKHRLGKAGEKIRAEELEAGLSELFKTLQANNKDEALNKISESDKQLKELMDKVNNLSTAYEKEQMEKESALLSSAIMEAITKKKLDDKGGIIKDALTFRATKNDSGQYVIGDESLEEYLQGQIDSETPMFKPKETTEEPPHGKKDDDSFEREIMGLSPKN